MNATTPRLREHLLAGQVPWPYVDYENDRGSDTCYVRPHLTAMERDGLVTRVPNAGSRDVRWQLVTP